MMNLRSIGAAVLGGLSLTACGEEKGVVDTTTEKVPWTSIGSNVYQFEVDGFGDNLARFRAETELEIHAIAEGDFRPTVVVAGPEHETLITPTFASNNDPWSHLGSYVFRFPADDDFPANLARFKAKTGFEIEAIAEGDFRPTVVVASPASKTRK